MTVLIREQISLSWKGEEFPLMVTMDLIARIENKINLSSFVADVANDEMKNSHAAILAANVLKEAGASASVDECYIALLGQDASKLAEVSNVISVALNAMFPISKKKTTKQKAKKPAAAKGTAKASTGP